MPAAALDAKQGLWRTKARPTRPRRGKASATKTGTTPAGGGGYLFSQTALAKVFRAKVLDATRDAGLSLPPSLSSLWVAHCKAVGDGQKALLYLGRYLYRSVIQEADILRCDDQGKVTFQYARCACGQPMQVVRRRMPALQAADEPSPPSVNSLPVQVKLPDKPGTGKAHTMH